MLTLNMNVSGAEGVSPLDTVLCFLAGLEKQGRKGLCSFFPTSPQLFFFSLMDAAVTGPRVASRAASMFSAFLSEFPGTTGTSGANSERSHTAWWQDAPPVLHLCDLT